MVIRPSQQGVVLIPMVVSLAIIAAVVHLVSSQQGMQAHSIAKQRDKEVASAVAEAGMRDALWRARKGGTSPTPVIGTLPGYGTYKATITKDPITPSKITINSTGVTTNNIEYNFKRTYSLACTGVTTTTTIVKYGIDANPTNIIENSVNNAQNGYLHPRNNTNERTRSLLKFDYGTVPPAGANIASAILLLDVQQYDPAMEGASLIVNRVIQTWIDSQATWKVSQLKKAWQSPDKTGGHFTLVDQGSTPIAASTLIYRIDITKIMQAWVNGSANDGLILRTDGSTDMGPTDFRLKGPSGNTTTHWPRLEVKWC